MIWKLYVTELGNFFFHHKENAVNFLLNIYQREHIGFDINDLYDFYDTKTIKQKIDEFLADDNATYLCLYDDDCIEPYEIEFQDEP